MSLLENVAENFGASFQDNQFQIKKKLLSNLRKQDCCYTGYKMC